MFKKLFIIGLLALSLFGSFAPVMAQIPSDDLKSGNFMFDLRSITHEDVKEERYINGGINFIFERAVTIMVTTVGSAAVLMITIGGFMMLASGGRQQWIDTGKSFIFKAVIGLAVVLGAYVLVTAIQILIKSIYG